MRKLLTVLLILLIFLTIGASCWFLLEFWCPPWWGKLFYPLKYKKEITEASNKYSLDPYLISAIIYEESKFDSTSQSGAGAKGLMQILPSTGRWAAAKMNLKDFKEDSLFDPYTNINIGSWYFSYLLKEYKSETLALAAYNGGRKNLDEWLKDASTADEEEFCRNIPFPETRKFVLRVRQTKEKYRKTYPEAFKD